MALQTFAIGLLAFGFAWPSHAAGSKQPATALIGTWHGTSVCTDRVAAPACNDESVIYDFTAGASPDTVHWKADKMVAGKRLPMGEFDLAYNRSDSSWSAELSTPRFHMLWRVTVEGAVLNGTATLLPKKQLVRKIEAHKD